MKDLWSVFIPAGLGIVAGLVFGDYCEVFRPFGAAYVMFLQAAVYPYVIASLLHGLGSLRPEQAFNLFKHGWWIYLLAWGLTFASLLLIALGIPPANSPIAQADGAGVDIEKVFNLVIPQDIIGAIAQNYVPAVIVFCVMYGIALERVEDKGPLLSILDAIRRMSLQFWKWVVKLVPFAVFALVADTAGTTALVDLEHLIFFLVLLFGVAVIIAFWMLPAVMSALAPLRYRDILSDLRNALVVSLATTLSVSALPYVAEATRKIGAQLHIPKEESDDVISTNLSITYVIGQLGNFFVMFFILFAFYFFQKPETLGNLILLPFMTLLSAVGSPTATVDSVAFLSQWLGLPAASPALFVELLVIVRYGMLMTSVIGFGFLSILVTLSYFGKLQLRVHKLLLAIGLPMLAIVGLALGTRVVQQAMVDPGRQPYLHFTLSPEATQGVKVEHRQLDDVGRAPTETPPSGQDRVLDRIQRTGELWVGYNDGIIPFSYHNRAGDLVGYDIEAAYSLAQSLGVKLILVPFEWEKLQTDLNTNRFDIAMAGIYVTNERLQKLEVSSPYYNSPVALFAPAERVAKFADRKKINQYPSFQVGSFDDPVLVPMLHRLFPTAEVVVVPPYSKLPDFKQVDAAVWTLEQATALAAANPGIQAIAPQDMGSNFLFAYLMPHGASEFRQYVDYWIDIREKTGSADEARAYWLQGEARRDAKPRWSVLRDVLGWK